MLSDGSQCRLTLVCALAIFGGCASVPPAPANAQNNAKTDNGEYDGWLFRSLTGRRKEATPPASSSGAANNPTNPAATTPTATPGSGVVAASATAPITTPMTPGPMVAGPASPSVRKTSGPTIIPAAGDTPIAGPPPSIPTELPPAPDGGVSIKDKDGLAEKKGFEWSDLAPENVWKNAKAAAGYGPDEKLAKAMMKEGEALFSEKKYKEAAAKFATAASRWPDSPLEEDALFLKGESEFFSDQYPKAHDTYGGLLKQYTNTRHLDTVMAREFALARYWEQLQDTKPTWPVTPNLTDGGRPLFDTFGYAIQAFERVRLNDPTGPLADDSLMAMANAYFRRGQFENAAYNYDLLIKEYPNSAFQKDAHLLGLQAKMRIYQGTTYIAAPLNEAKGIADKTLAMGDKLGPERENVALARAQIVEEQANREFMLGEYYEGKKYYGAARMYYKSVIDEFPTTERAKEAKVRMEKIRNEPDSPPNRMAWLTGMFEPKKQ